MKRRAWVILLLAFVTSAQTVGLGFTVAPRVLFPLYDPYEGDDDIERGVAVGFSFSFDLRLFPGFTVGPYFGGLFATDTDPPPTGGYEGKYYWSDLVVGASVRFAVPTGGPWRPRMSVAFGYAPLSFRLRYDYPWGSFETDGHGGGFGLDAGFGVDYRISETFSVGFGAKFHLNTADRLERTVDGETVEWDLDESPLGLGFGFDVGVSL